MVRKMAIAFGILLGVSAVVLDGSASTAEACWGCRSGSRTSCCRSSCWAPRSCCSTCYAPAPCYNSCNSCAPVYVAPACSSCSASYYAYPAPINVAQVPGYGAQYGYAVPVINAPSRVVYRARLVTVR